MQIIISRITTSFTLWTHVGGDGRQPTVSYFRPASSSPLARSLHDKIDETLRPMTMEIDMNGMNEQHDNTDESLSMIGTEPRKLTSTQHR